MYELWLVGLNKQTDLHQKVDLSRSKGIWSSYLTLILSTPAIESPTNPLAAFLYLEPCIYNLSK